MDAFPLVSVIIPVYNDAERLKKCLTALEDQSYPADSYEVIVVDNASEEAQNIKNIASQFSHVHYTYEEQPGSYVARNQGLSLAKGEIIAFTDADCIPTVNWLEVGVEALVSYPKCGLAAGKIEIFFENPSQPTLVEIYESVTGFPQEKFLAQFHGAVTANVFTYRTIFEQVGLFDSSLKSFGDFEWGNRVYQEGYAQIYVEKALVFHPARYSWLELSRRTKRVAGGCYDLLLKQSQSFWQRQASFLYLLMKNLIPPVFFTINTLRDDRLNGMGQKLKVSLLMLLVRYISAWETLRLKLGGTSNRA